MNSIILNTKKNSSEEARKKRTTDVYSTTYEEDLKKYEKTMKAKLIFPDDKYFENIDFSKLYEEEELRCTCGTEAVHGKVPNKAHSHICDLRKKENKK